MNVAFSPLRTSKKVLLVLWTMVQRMYIPCFVAFTALVLATAFFKDTKYDFTYFVAYVLSVTIVDANFGWRSARKGEKDLDAENHFSWHRFFAEDLPAMDHPDGLRAVRAARERDRLERNSKKTFADIAQRLMPEAVLSWISVASFALVTYANFYTYRLSGKMTNLLIVEAVTVLLFLPLARRDYSSWVLRRLLQRGAAVSAPIRLSILARIFFWDPAKLDIPANFNRRSGLLQLMPYIEEPAG